MENAPHYEKCIIVCSNKQAVTCYTERLQTEKWCRLHTGLYDYVLINKIFIARTAAASFTKECRKARTKSRIVKQLDFLYQFGRIYRAIFAVSELFTSISTLGVRNTDSQEGAQIDLLIIRSDNVVNLCEMKFAGEPYIIIDKEEETKLRKRIEILKNYYRLSKPYI